MFFSNETEEGFTPLKPVTVAPCSPIFSPKDDITPNSSITETANEILNDPLLKDHQAVPEIPEDTDSNDKSSTTPTKLKTKDLLEKDVSDGTLNLKKPNSLTSILAYLF